MFKAEQRTSCVYRVGEWKVINSVNIYYCILLDFIDSINCKKHHYFTY